MKKNSYLHKLGFNQKGQLVIEYVLLLSISAVIAAIIVNKLGSRNEDEPGAIIKGWTAVIKSIAEDQADSCFKPNCQ
ncbi:MAG: hypothetical protein J0M15_11995 [Deltaproteobacteria bacterium]|nr:hypothetical protein [Deltaproteobacteria bacterium]